MLKKFLFIIFVIVFFTVLVKEVYKITLGKSYLSNTNTNLEILAIEDELLNVPFDASITNYSVEISNKISELNVLAIPENENAYVSIEGKDNLQVGSNLIRIIVTSEDGGVQKIYEVDVYKRNEEEEIRYNEKVKENQEILEQYIKMPDK